MAKTTNPLAKKSGVSTNIILTVIVVVVAVVVIGGVLLFSGGTGKGGPPSQTVAEKVLRKPDSHTLTTAKDGKVTLVEFLDYQCPACHQYYQGITQRLEKQYSGRIDFVTRNFPLESQHPLSVSAAKAAEAAGLQGKYKQMYHALYDSWQSWAVDPSGQEVNSDQQKADQLFDQYARQIGLDMAKFHRDEDSPQVQKRIDTDRADGNKAGVSGTPTFFVNGQRFEPSGQTFQDVLQQFQSKLDQELKK